MPVVTAMLLYDSDGSTDDLSTVGKHGELWIEPHGLLLFVCCWW